ncbi:TPA: S24 family peptidase [Streptococcus suis]
MIEEQLKYLMELRFGSIKAFANQNDLPYSTVRSILSRGVMNSNADNVFKICSILEVDPKVLAEGGDFSPLSSPIHAIYNQLEPTRQEKVLDYAEVQLEEQNKVTSIFEVREDSEDYITDYVKGLVAAGHGTFQEDNLNMEVRLRANDVPEKYDTIAKVAGDSMEPMIKDNDLLFINVTSQVEINDIGIFQINGKNFIKKLKRDYDGRWYLQSLNNSYEEIYLNEDDDIRTIGEVVDIYRR